MTITNEELAKMLKEGAEGKGPIATMSKFGPFYVLTEKDFKPVRFALDCHRGFLGQLIRRTKEGLPVDDDLIASIYDTLAQLEAATLNAYSRGGRKSSKRFECVETLVKKAIDVFGSDVTAQAVFGWIVKKIKRRQKELEADVLTTDCLECEGDNETMYEVRAYPGATSVQDNKLTVTVVSAGDRSEPHPIAWRTFSENYVAKIRKELTGPQ